MKSQFAFITVFMFALMMNIGYAAQVDTVTKKQQLLAAVDRLSLDKLDKAYNKTEERLAASLTKYLRKFQRSEEKLIKKLKVKDSIAALQKARGLQEQYDQLANRIKNPEQVLKTKLQVTMYPS